MDFKELARNDKFYGGSEKKIGVTDGTYNYMIKFQKNSPFGKRYNHISEYIGSKVFELLGFSTQTAYLGKFNDEFVVACVDFTSNKRQFVPFNDVGESSLDEDKENYQYTYDDIMEMLHDNKKITNVEETIEIFWEMFIVDALLGNFDRHGANWGFIKENNKYILAPIFDNGSCLFPQLIDDSIIDSILESEEETDKRIYNFPTSQVKIDNKKSSYFEVISSLKFKECNDALIKIYHKINLYNIYKIIDDIEYISEKRKDFYKHIIKNRYLKIIDFSYKKIMEGKHELL